jgi:subfamily B ATP-binding cassette protein MsbA
MRIDDNRRSWREVARTFGPDILVHRREIIRSYAFRVLEVATGVLAPWPLKIVIDHVLSSRPLPGALRQLDWGLSGTGVVIAAGVAIVVISTVRGAADARQKTIGARIRERLSLQLRDRMLAHLQRLPPTLRTSHRSGELVLRIVGDVEMFVRLQTRILPAIFENGLTTLATFAVMVWIAPPLALLTLAILPALALLLRHYGRRLRAASRAKRRHEGNVAGLAQEIVRGLPAIQALGGERHSRERFARMNAQSLQAGVEETRATVQMEQAMRLAHGLSVALIVCVGARLVTNGTLTIGGLTVMASYIVQLLKPIERLNDIAETASRGLTGGERLMALLALSPAVEDAPDAVAMTRASGVVEFREVSFGYPTLDGGPIPVLRGVTLRVEPNQMMVLVGPSGAGKSTLIGLLLRLFDPDSGVILLDGRPLRSITLASLRAQVASMAQDTHLFAGTVRSALLPAGAELPDHRLWEALALVALDEFVRTLPRALDAALGEDGVNLSGGQRQRLSLARAFLLDRPILVLDEPLAHVDAESEAVIVRALQRLRAGRTCIAVTRQPALFECADIIYRLDNGRVVEVAGAGGTLDATGTEAG